MRSHQFDYALREEEAAPALGSMPESPTNPDSSGGKKKNDLTARNTLLGISDDEADKDRESKAMLIHQPLLRNNEPIFPHHGMLSGTALPVDAERLGDDKWEVTFRYDTVAQENFEMLTDVHGKQLDMDPNDVEPKTEIVDDEFLDWLEGHGMAGGDPTLGSQEPQNPAPIAADPMGAAPGMPGAGPMAGAGTTMQQNMGVPTG